MTNATVVFISSKGHTLTNWFKAAEAAGIAIHNVAWQPGVPLASSDFKGCQLVIEWTGLPEDQRQILFQQVEALVSLDCPIMAAAHEVMASRIAGWLSASERLVGFSPLGSYRSSILISLSKTLLTLPETCETVDRLLMALGLRTCWINDTPGLVLPRIYAMIANEAAFAVQEQVASAADIDTAMRLGTNYPYGPLQWADMVGVDTVLHILNTLWETYKDERYRPCLLLQKLVAAGHTGVQSGRGFYSYNTDEPPIDGLLASSVPSEQVSSVL